MVKVVAIDIGASSGRAIVGSFTETGLMLEEVYRFENQPIHKGGTLYWDIDKLFKHILIGIEKAKSEFPDLYSLGIDTWGVDFGMLDENDQLIANPIHYRDERTNQIFEKINDFINFQDLYKKTGNQILEINTLFQLMAEKFTKPNEFHKCNTLLMMPDLLNFMLTGKKAAEISIASTTQLFDPYQKKWAEEILKSFGIPAYIFPEIVTEGHVMGMLKKELGLGAISVVNVCAHDTASAVVSIPSNDPFIYISCGTWSLIGTELTRPLITSQTFAASLTNESGHDQTTRLLKNCTGLWIIQELMRNYRENGNDYSYETINEQVNLAEPELAVLDTDDPLFASPGDMIGRIKKYTAETGQAIPQKPGEFFRVVYESLALKYQQVIQDIEVVTTTKYPKIHIVGGGSNSAILCQMIANATDKEVLAGPTEATAIGNIIVQLISAGYFADVAEARSYLQRNLALKKYHKNN